MTDTGPRPPGPLDPLERARWRVESGAYPRRRFLVTLQRGYLRGTKVVGVTAGTAPDAILIARADVPDYPEVRGAVEVESR